MRGLHRGQVPAEPRSQRNPVLNIMIVHLDERMKEQNPTSSQNAAFGEEVPMLSLRSHAPLAVHKLCSAGTFHGKGPRV